jgi:hypothetical protein
MNRTMITALLLSGSFAGPAHCQLHAADAYSPARIGRNITIADNSATNRAVVPGSMAADPTDPAQNREGAIYFSTSTQKYRVFQGGAWRDLGSGGEDLLLAGGSPCDAVQAGKKALTVDIENAPANTFPPSPPYVANIRWATCTSRVYRGRTIWFWQ